MQEYVHKINTYISIICEHGICIKYTLDIFTVQYHEPRNTYGAYATWND